ncbi:MAG: hypothetical protein HC879_09890 [Leptolyngbyaceae cyanobacterium SL_5_9]|nr:hypothetical protein [Leptolyngbyaceae cyanobacterium SL_5_9]NJO74837.1 hypothetical protein [Leptolyngbyaceae cyanobacterium RM1_406_9]
MLLKSLRKLLNKNSHRNHASTKRWLEKRGIRNTDFKVRIVDDEKIESTEDFLAARGIDRSAVVADELRKAEAKHRINSRMIVLLSLIVPMSIAPFWLMALLSLPAFGKKPYSDYMQGAFLTALVSDFVGLYYVITRDLFPQGENSRRNASNGKIDDQSEELDNSKDS